MAYRLPVFNQPVGVYEATTVYGVPDQVTVGNLATGRRTTAFSYYDLAEIGLVPTEYLLVPADAIGTGVCENLNGTFVPSTTGFPVAEVPADSGFMYVILDTLEIALGFGNEHRAYLMVKYTLALQQQLDPANSWGYPTWPTVW